jgi:hypothetical protein
VTIRGFINRLTNGEKAIVSEYGLYAPVILKYDSLVAGSQTGCDSFPLLAAKHEPAEWYHRMLFIKDAGF